jgi:hypothetical protein
MHLLGNMWGQNWEIRDIVLPFKNVQQLDVTKELIRQKYTPLKMFKVAEDFFKSINLKPMPKSFWKNSVIEKPLDGREIICHASAWNMGIKNDVRIKQCTRISFESLVTIHHEVFISISMTNCNIHLHQLPLLIKKLKYYYYFFFKFKLDGSH